MDKHDAKRKFEEDGFLVVENAIDNTELAIVNEALEAAMDVMRERNIPLHSEFLDPNPSSVRINNLPEFNPIFVSLLTNNAALDMVRACIGDNILISNFTANIGYPGSGSMKIHSDQALVVPPPWLSPWAINIVWCFDDVRAENGATRYIPGSHLWRTFEDVPENAMELTKAFEAPAGSFIAMEGRLWHTSGENRTDDERRAMAFAYYSTDFIRPQINWSEALSAKTKGDLDDTTRKLFGIGVSGNVRIGGAYVQRNSKAEIPNKAPLGTGAS